MNLLLLSGLLENLGEGGPDSLRGLRSVDSSPDALLLVVLSNGTGLLMVRLEALVEGLSGVVGALDEGLASDVVDHVLLRGRELLVVGATGSGVDETTGDAGDEEVVVDEELDGVLEGLLAGSEHLVELLSLGDITGETVEDEAVCCRSVSSSSSSKKKDERREKKARRTRAGTPCSPQADS
jgi:hypothetical protein